MGRWSLHGWREWRRLRAWRLSRRGWPAHAIAEALGASRAAVSQWLATARKGGRGALLWHRRPGAPGKLTAEQRHLIVDFLWHGAEAYGFRGDVWTGARVAKVIEEELGVHYHRHHVCRMLKRLGWTPQVPITRAIQRNEAEICRWQQEVWPVLLARARAEKRSILLADESGFYLLPGVVRTYGPKGVTPVIHNWQTRDHLSVMGAITTDGRLYTLVRQRPLNGLDTIAFLEHLLHRAGRRMLVIWDRSPIHRRKKVSNFIKDVRNQRLWVEFLPPYAPDLNPTEWLWRYLKKVRMRNLVNLDLEELHENFHLAICNTRRHPGLIRSFFKSAGLPLRC